MAFRVLDQIPVYLDAAGLPLAGGSLTFYATGTTTPQNVYADQALTVNNGNVVTLDSAGRTTVDVWGNGVYTVVLKDVNGVQVGASRDNVQDLSVTFPTGTAGQFLSTDGASPAVLSFATVTQVPSMTGNSGKLLTNNGTAASWTATPSLPYGTKSTSVWETTQVLTATTTLSVDLSLGSVVVLNQAVDCALTFTNLPTAGFSQVLTLVRIKDATGTSRALTWSTAPKWPGGVAITLTQTTGAIDVFSLLFYNGVTAPLASYNAAMA